MIKISDFQKHIALYGADLSRWPVQDIKPAVDLIQHSTEAGKIFAEAEKFDQLLRHYQPSSVNLSRLADSIVKTTKSPPSKAKRSFLPNPAYFFVPGGGMLVAAILGFMIGFHPAVKEEFLLDPAFYTQEQIVSDSGADVDNEGAS